MVKSIILIFAFCLFSLSMCEGEVNLETPFTSHTKIINYSEPPILKMDNACFDFYTQRNGSYFHTSFTPLAGVFLEFYLTNICRRPRSINHLQVKILRVNINDNLLLQPQAQFISTPWLIFTDIRYDGFGNLNVCFSTHNEEAFYINPGQVVTIKFSAWPNQKVTSFSVYGVTFERVPEPSGRMLSISQAISSDRFLQIQEQANPNLMLDNGCFDFHYQMDGKKFKTSFDANTGIFLEFYLKNICRGERPIRHLQLKIIRLNINNSVLLQPQPNFLGSPWLQFKDIRYDGFGNLYVCFSTHYEEAFHILPGGIVTVKFSAWPREPVKSFSVYDIVFERVPEPEYPGRVLLSNGENTEVPVNPETAEKSLKFLVE